VFLEALMLTTSMLPFVLLTIAWIFSTAVSAWLIHSITKTVIEKASIEELPKVIDSLNPLLSSLSRALSRRLSFPSTVQVTSEPRDSGILEGHPACSDESTGGEA
jgi:hypothetical protein